MIIPVGGSDKALGVHLNRAYRTGGIEAGEPTRGADTVSITKFSALVDRGRAGALALPATRADLVAQAKARIQSGDMPAGADVASSMINSAVEGQV